MKKTFLKDIIISEKQTKENKKERQVTFLMKRFAIIVIIGLLSAGSYTALCATTDTKHILPNTTVNDVDISGMTQSEATAVLKTDADLRSKSSEFSVSFEDNRYTINVSDALTLDYEAAAKEAFSEGHSGFFTRGLARIKAYLTGNHISHPPVTENSKILQEQIEASGILNAVTAAKDTYKIENEKLLLTMGAAKKPDEDKLKKVLLTAVQTKDFGHTIPCPTVSDDMENLERVYQEVYTKPKNSTLDRDNNYAITEAVTGIDFDKENAKKILAEAKEGETVKIDLIYMEPEISAQNLRDRLFVDDLASYTTKVTGSSNRRTNVRLAAEKCNSKILLSGDELSFNGAVGEQTAKTGFKPAGATLNGKPVLAYGGGICQVSSTIFAAALFANLEIVERWEHDYVSSYIVAGLDAAVAWNELDFRIANNTSYPIILDVIYTDDNLTVTIRGTKTDDAVVKIQTKTLDSSTADTLEVATYRNVYTENGSQVFTEEIAHSKYAR